MSDIQVYPAIKRAEKKLPFTQKRFTLFATLFCIFLIVVGVIVPGIGYRIVSKRYQRDVTLARTGIDDLEAASQILQVIRYDPFNLQAMYHAQDTFTDALIAFTRLNKDLPNIATRLPIPSLRASKHLVQLGIEMARTGQATCNILTLLAAHLAHYPEQEQENMRDRVSSYVRISRGTYTRMQAKTSTPSKALTSAYVFKMADVLQLKRNLRRIDKALTQVQLHIQQLKPADLQFDPRIEKAVSAIRFYLPVAQQGLQQAETFMTIVPFIAGIKQPTHYLIEFLLPHKTGVNANLIESYSMTLVGGQLAALQPIDTQNVGKEQYTGIITITPALLEHFLALNGPLTIPEYHEILTAKNLEEHIEYHKLVEEAQFVPATMHFSALLEKHFVEYLQSLPGSLLPTILHILATSLYDRELQVHFTSATTEVTWQQTFSFLSKARQG